MFAGNLLFNDPVQVWKYALTASSSLLALDNIGLSTPCVSFLHDILQPIPEDRPSAEDCLKKAWITTEVPRPEYSIGKDLHIRLAKISHQAPNVHSFLDMIANRAVESSSIPWEPLVAIGSWNKRLDPNSWSSPSFPSVISLSFRRFSENSIIDEEFHCMFLWNPNRHNRDLMFTHQNTPGLVTFRFYSLVLEFCYISQFFLRTVSIS